MGLGRMVWRSTGIGRIIDTAKNMVEEGSIIEGYERTIREDIYEDNPITSVVYQAGRYDGKIEGYEEASDEYKEKLLRQADEFLKQKKYFERERDAYEKLLDEYDREIDALNAKVNKTEAEKEYLHQLLLMERELRKLDS